MSCPLAHIIKINEARIFSMGNERVHLRRLCCVVPFFGNRWTVIPIFVQSNIIVGCVPRTMVRMAHPTISLLIEKCN